MGSTPAVQGLNILGNLYQTDHPLKLVLSQLIYAFITRMEWSSEVEKYINAAAYF